MSQDTKPTSRFWIRNAYFMPDDNSLLYFYIPRRCNSRRMRQRARQAWSNQLDHERFDRDHRNWEVIRAEGGIRTAAHCVDYINQGGSLKAYSAWSGMRLRELSKLVYDYQRGRLRMQRTIAPAMLQVGIDRGRYLFQELKEAM